MSIESHQQDTAVKELISGILSDVQKLASQQLALLRAEVRADWDKTKRAMRPMIAGTVFAAVGVILAGFTAALWLYWSVSPPGGDHAQLPLWACFGFASLSFLVLGAAFIIAGVRLFQSFNPLPNETIKAFESNLKAIVH